MPGSPACCLFVDLWRLSTGTLRVLVDRHASGGARCDACPRVGVGSDVGYLCRNYVAAEQALYWRNELWIGGASLVDRRRRYCDPIGIAVGAVYAGAAGGTESGAR